MERGRDSVYQDEASGTFCKGLDCTSVALILILQTIDFTTRFQIRIDINIAGIHNHISASDNIESRHPLKSDSYLSDCIFKSLMIIEDAIRTEPIIMRVTAMSAVPAAIWLFARKICTTRSPASTPMMTETSPGNPR